ncbi:MAG: hypothetical protein R3B13_10400 [Polyangiaceae bacterium]
MTRPRVRVGHWLLAALLASCSADEEGCKTDNDCKGDRVCNAGNCVDPSSGGNSSGGNSSGGNSSGGTSSGGTAGVAGCPSKCVTGAGTCCLEAANCDLVPPCAANPCCQ